MCQEAHIMDKVLEHFGIYDFMGVWGPGALTVTYFYFTMQDLFSNFLFYLTLPELSDGYVLLIIYTAVAYIAGIILHEAGKLITERLEKFSFESIKMQVHQGELLGQEPYLRIEQEYKTAIEHSIPDRAEYNRIDFDSAVACIKYGGNTGTKRIDKYHAIYALSRSLTLCFGAHAVMLLAIAMVDSGCTPATPVMAAFDVIMVGILWIRTYRYFCMWVKNVFLQYHFIKLKSTMSGNEQT